MAEDKKFASGIFFNKPHQNAPDWVLGSISIRPQDFVSWLHEQDPDDKGYIRLQVAVSKSSGKPYVALDTWKREQKENQDRGEKRGRW
jgi:hypothetical protein